MSKKVLIVEDSYGDRMMLKEHLASSGFSVVGEARSIRESIEKYEQFRPELVLMDVGIPDSDGVSAVIKLLQLDYRANIIVCATRGQRSLAIEAIAAGAKDFVTKPINPRALHRTLQTVAGAAALR